MPCFASHSWKYFLNRLTPNISLLILHTVSHISHLEKIRPHYFLLVLFNISSENLVSNQLFFQLLITCLLESVRYCKEKLHPDQYWEWRFCIGQTNSKCTFLVTLRKKKCLKFVNPRGKSVDFSAKLLWWFDICVVASFMKGRRLSLFCLPFCLATTRTVTEKLYVLKKEQELAPGDQTNVEFDSFVIPPVRQPTTKGFGCIEISYVIKVSA